MPELEQVRLIGIDCAVQPKNVAIAVGNVRGGGTTIEKLVVGPRDPASTVVDLLTEPALLALDSPLGWPAGLGVALADHAAGEPVAIEPNTLFRRDTDRFVKRAIGKQPLDVGADRIARTAHAALKLLHAVRDSTGKDVPLAWQPEAVTPLKCIEVYPAATLKAHGIVPKGYKARDPSGRAERRKLIDMLKPRLDIDASLERYAVDSDDALDAAICCLAAADFLQGLCFAPEDGHTAEKEGWIWIRRPDDPIVESPAP